MVRNMATLSKKVELVGSILRTIVQRLAYSKAHQSHLVQSNARFMSADAAAALIPDGCVLASTGLGQNAVIGALHIAIKRRFKSTGHPHNLTLVCAGGTGVRGKYGLGLGSPEELAFDGLLSKFIVGHFETYEAMRKMAGRGSLEVHILPQGVITMIMESMGEDLTRTWVGPTGKGTFFDVASGGWGTRLCGFSSTQLVRAVGGDSLEYSLPIPDVAILNAPAADRRGNIYFRGASQICESLAIARAARKNGGKVLVQVGLLVADDYQGVCLQSKFVDAIVLNPYTEQTLVSQHRSPMTFLSPDGPRAEPASDCFAQLTWVNRVLRVKPRGGVDMVLGRLASRLLTQCVPRGAVVNIGTGLPEVVAEVLLGCGVINDVKMVVESGVWGGVPGPGSFFGAAVYPTKIMSSGQTFRRLCERLDLTVLGALQVDSQGNVNVSRPIGGVSGYIGPGGFVDLTTWARTIVFVSTFQMRQKLAVRSGGRLAVLSRGEPKFVPLVREVTFSAREALRRKQRVFYVTPLGIFRLTKTGLELFVVTPGVDVDKDVLRGASARLRRAPDIARARRDVVTGEGFEIRFRPADDEMATALAAGNAPRARL